MRILLELDDLGYNVTEYFSITSARVSETFEHIFADVKVVGHGNPLLVPSLEVVTTSSSLEMGKM